MWGLGGIFWWFWCFFFLSFSLLFQGYIVYMAQPWARKAVGSRVLTAWMGSDGKICSIGIHQDAPSGAATGLGTAASRPGPLAWQTLGRGEQQPFVSWPVRGTCHLPHRARGGSQLGGRGIDAPREPWAGPQAGGGCTCHGHPTLPGEHNTSRAL